MDDGMYFSSWRWRNDSTRCAALSEIRKENMDSILNWRTYTSGFFEISRNAG